MNLRFKKQLDELLGSLMVGLLYFPIRIFGIILKRDHNLHNSKNICVVKMLGGGSLLNLLPFIEEMKLQYPDKRISIICTNAVSPFAKSLRVFDEIKVINDKSLFLLLKSSFETLLWALRNIDTVIDLEVHSKLTTVFCSLTLARNRIGLLDHSSLWRRRIYTHSIYVNPTNVIYSYYDSLAHFFGIQFVSIENANSKFSERIKSLDVLPWRDRVGAYYAVGVGCSDLCLERMLTPQEWATNLIAILEFKPEVDIVFLGGPRDRVETEKIIDYIPKEFHERFIDMCGKSNLDQSLRILADSAVFLGIDSALLHFARTLKIPNISFWGPTSSKNLLKKSSVKSLQFESAYSCSPCVHLTEIQPCMNVGGCNTHKNSEQKVVEFINSITKIEVTSQIVVSHDFWAYYPESFKLPRRNHVQIIS